MRAWEMNSGITADLPAQNREIGYGDKTETLPPSPPVVRLVEAFLIEREYPDGLLYRACASGWVLWPSLLPPGLEAVNHHFSKAAPGFLLAFGS